MTAIRLIAMDLDGTLLDNQGRLPAENAQVVAEAAAQGIEIVLATGRRFDSARAFAVQMACPMHVISSNGALTKTVSGETLSRRLLPAAVARRVLAATERFRSEAGVVFDRATSTEIVLERIDWDDPLRGAYYRKYRESVREIRPLAACLDGPDSEDPIQVMFTGGCERMRAAQETLRKLANGGAEFSLALADYPARDLAILDVLEHGVTKGVALADWAHRRGMAREEVMAIGDNWNDREMLEYAGVPVVMANAVAEVMADAKNRDWNMTLSNEQCGVAHAVRRHALLDGRTNGRAHGRK
jgi:Cof subfamily protein (haloacid dehalogenase superfamily)